MAVVLGSQTTHPKLKLFSSLYLFDSFSATAASILQLKLILYTLMSVVGISKWSMPSPYCEFPWASGAQVGISGGIIITIYILLLFWFSSLLLSGWLNDDAVLNHRSSTNSICQPNIKEEILYRRGMAGRLPFLELRVHIIIIILLSNAFATGGGHLEGESSTVFVFFR